MKLKILFIVDDFSGGAGNVIQILANAFALRKNDVNVLLLNHHTDYNRLDDKVDVIKTTITNQNSNSKIVWLTQTIASLNKLIVGIEPDVVISFLDNNNTIVGLSLMFNDIPLIVSERSNPVIIKPNFAWRILRIPAYLRANAVIVQCSNFINFNRLFSKKTSVIPNPIMRPKFRQNRDFHNDNIKIVSIGRLAKVKQFNLMIHAFAKINKKIPNTELYIYGDGDERPSLEKLIHQLSLQNKVFLPGRTTEVYDVLHNNDIYLMTSKQEGFPNALCEAMVAGLPVVAFECHEGLRDIVDHGQNGFLVPPDDIDNMAKCTGLLIQDANLRQVFSKNARVISEKFSIEKVLNTWETMIQEVMVSK
ncbi:MAG: glycosyltransferase [Tissierellia bacterium]|nr:glycosyltransferase [Tissierellia bacterium]